MSTDPFWDRIKAVYQAAGVPHRTTDDDRVRFDAMAEQMEAVRQVVAHWDSPGLYENDGARRRCLAVMSKHHEQKIEDLNTRTADWDFVSADSSDFDDLPPFDPNSPEHQSVPRLIFAKDPRIVRIFRGGVLDAIGPYLLTISRAPHSRCDWGDPTHPIKPTAFTDPNTGERHVTFSKPYLTTKSMGEYLLVFVVCTQCLEDLITRSDENYLFGPNARDRELIDGKWLPIWSNPRKAWIPNGGNPVQVTQWSTNDGMYPSDQFTPAAFLINGIRFVIPHSTSQWREDDHRTSDDLQY